MAAGQREDWRPMEPSTADLREAEHDVPVLLAEFAKLTVTHHGQATTETGQLRHIVLPWRRARLKRSIRNHWNAIGHLAQVS
jgi:hypothetical protein